MKIKTAEEWIRQERLKPSHSTCTLTIALCVRIQIDALKNAAEICRQDIDDNAQDCAERIESIIKTL